MKNPLHSRLTLETVFVPRTGVEPVRPKAMVFETIASTNSATWAKAGRKIIELFLT